MDDNNVLVCKVDLSVHVERLVNAQIARELNAAQAYLAMYAWCKRVGVALDGFAQFFQKASDEERQHAQLWIDYLNERGGTVCIGRLEAPLGEFDHVRTAVKGAYDMEKRLHTHLLGMHAHEEADPHLQDFIEGTFLTEQVRAEKELSDLYTNLQRAVGGAHGLYMFDRIHWK
jgi:ferritin